MASILLTGVLLDPNGDPAYKDQVRFTHKSTTGDTISGAVSVEKMPADGSYSIELEYGNILVEYKDAKKPTFNVIGIVTVNQDSTATSLPELLNAIVPPTDEQLLEFQAILADCVAAADRAETAAETAEAAIKHYTLAEAKALTGAVIGQIIQITDRGNGQFEAVSSAINTPDEKGIIQGQADIAWKVVDINGEMRLSHRGVEKSAAETPYIQSLLASLQPNGLKFVSDVELELDDTLTITGFKVDVQFLENITATNEKPILDIKCGYSKVRGKALGMTTLYSAYSPEGIICTDDLGAGNISYNEIGGFELQGELQPTGGGSKGLVMRSLDGYTHFTYYNKISDFKIRNVDTGMYLDGNVNASFFKNIFLENCGNNQTYSDSAGVFLNEAFTAGSLFEGPLENSFSHIFHTASANAVSLLINGNCNNNTITGYGAETGGASSLGLKTLNSGSTNGNIIIFTSLAFAGDDIDPEFLEKNTYINSLNSNLRDVSTPKLTTGEVNQSGDIVTSSGKKSIKQGVKSGLIQNSTYKIMEQSLSGISAADLLTFDIEIELSRNWGSIGRSYSRVVCTYSMADGLFRVVSIDDTDFIGELFEPVVGGGLIEFYYKAYNAGTGSNAEMSITASSRCVEDASKTGLINGFALDLSNAVSTPSVGGVMRSYGSTSSRVQSPGAVGFDFFDTTLGKKISWDGVNWVDGSGAVV